jgi:hypothetical protein
MLFKPEHIEMIKNGKKRVTRRNWKRRMVKVGGIYKVKTKMLSKDYHCKIKVNDVSKDRLGNMNKLSAMNEGYETVEDYKKVWENINGKNSWNDDLKVYVISFELVEDDYET